MMLVVMIIGTTLTAVKMMMMMKMIVDPYGKIYVAGLKTHLLHW